MNYSIAVLITCFNRKQLTLNCLHNLYNQGYIISVYLVDDGSSDGTSDSIKCLFPDVNLILGNGDLFWNRGMHLAWEIASASNYDFYIWLNDDTVLFDNAFDNIFNVSFKMNNKSIICGAIKAIDDDLFTYGGKDKNLNPVLPNNKNDEICFLNGNFVLIPSYVFKKVGNLDSFFHHDLGDYDYGLRARKIGLKIYTTEVFVGSCDRNVSLNTKGRKSNLNLIERFRRLYSPFGFHPIQQFVFHFRHSNSFYAFYIFLKLNLVNIISDKFYFKFIKK